MRLPEAPNDCAGCHQGLLSNVLEPPPPPAVAVNGAGYSVAFQAPWDAIELSPASVRLVPRTASTDGAEAAQETSGFLSDELTWLESTTAANAAQPLSPAVTTVVM